MVTTARLSVARLPLWTLFLCGAALLIFSMRWLQELLIYDRAAISHGEYWRLITGNFVHHSRPHLALDIAMLLTSGSLIEFSRYRRFPLLCLISAAGIGAALYVGKPDMLYYGGLSGVAIAALTYFCLHGLREEGAWRWLCATALGSVVVKIIIELATGQSLLAQAGDRSFLPVPLAHAVGAMIAVLFFVLPSGSRAAERPSGKRGV